jgi:hypothetical protein
MNGERDNQVLCQDKIAPDSQTWPWPRLRALKKRKPLGKTSPYNWVVELVHGCNLSCGHCSCRLDPKGVYHFMDEQTWRETWSIMRKVTPTCRADICLGGEPTLHPRLYDYLRIARELSPDSQIQITTNGTMLMQGKIAYAGLIASGANIVYTDMYGPRKRFIEMAKESKLPWYEYYNRPSGAPSPWTYHGPHVKLIVLQEQPAFWPKSRLRAGLLGTWYNHLDWQAAKRFGLKPVTEPLKRRCNQPFIYANVDSRGNYLLCCQDNTGETSGKFGSVHDGVPGFLRFWYGKELQIIRRRLRDKNRADTSYCSRCCITFARCDYKHWTDEQVNQFWDGAGWQQLPKDEKGSHRAPTLLPIWNAHGKQDENWEGEARARRPGTIEEGRPGEAVGG